MVANINLQNANLFGFAAWMLVMGHVAKHAGFICNTQALLRM